MKKIFLLSLLFYLVFSVGSSNSFAVKLNSGDWKFGINGFLDSEYTWMEDTPDINNGTLDRQDEISEFDQNHLNLLFGAEKGKSRVNINIHSHHAFSSDHHKTTGEFSVQEAYGVYSFSNMLKLQAGNMLTPFGIYNSTRYITPLFATVVLPQTYEMPHNYETGTDSVSRYSAQ